MKDDLTQLALLVVDAEREHTAGVPALQGVAGRRPRAFRPRAVVACIGEQFPTAARVRTDEGVIQLASKLQFPSKTRAEDFHRLLEAGFDCAPAQRGR